MRAVAALGALLAVVIAPAVASAQKYRVEIDSEPPGATVYLDHKEDGPLGVTPFTGLIEDGTYELLFELDGYAPRAKMVRVKKSRGKQRVSVSLDKLETGTVFVTAPSGTAAVGAEVRIDGTPVGTAPDEFAVTVGAHVVEVVPDDGDPYEEWIQVEEGGRLEVVPKLAEVAEEEIIEDEDDDGGGGGGGGSVTKSYRRPRGYFTALAVVDAGIELGGRSFKYIEGRTTNLRPYDAFGIPMFHAGAEIYPLAGHRKRGLRGFGVVAEFSMAVALESEASDGEVIDTGWSELSIGGRVRHALSRRTLIGGSISYGAINFRFDQNAAIFPEIPDVGYRFVRFGGDVRHDTGALDVIFAAGLLGVYEAGTTASRFRATTTFGFDLDLGFAAQVTQGFELRAMASYRGVYYQIQSMDGDPYVAAGAQDHLFSGTLSGAYIY